MKKIKYIEKVEKIQVIEDILCNKCGKSIYLGDEFISGVKICVLFGYGSNKDGLINEFHICDLCYNLIIENFVFEPDIK